MKRLILVFILGVTNTIIFLVVASYLYASYWFNSRAFFIPIGFYFALIIALCVLSSYLISVHIIKFVPFLSQAKSATIKETAVLTIMGLIMGAGILFARDFVPTYFYRKQQKEVETSITDFRREALSVIEMDQPVFIAGKDYVNAPQGIDQFRFTIEIPLRINKSFTETQLLNTFQVSFASQGDKIFLPPIEGCYVDGYQLPLEVSPKLNKGTNNPNFYKLKFSYNYVRNPKFPSYSQCSVASANKLQGENVILFVLGEIPGGKIVGTYPIKTIQYK